MTNIKSKNGTVKLRERIEVCDATYLERCELFRRNKKLADYVFIVQGYNIEDDESMSRVALCDINELDAMIEKLQELRNSLCL